MLNTKSVFDIESRPIEPEDHYQFFVGLIRRQKTVDDLYLLSRRLANDLEEHETYRPIQQRLGALIENRRQSLVKKWIRRRVTWQYEYKPPLHDRELYDRELPKQ